MTWKKKFVAALAIIVTIWFVSPIPEGAIIMSLITGGTGINLGIPWYYSFIVALASFPITFYLGRRWRLLEKLKAMMK